MVLLAVRMVADVTETLNVIPSLDFKTCMTIKSYISMFYAINKLKLVLILGFKELDNFVDLIFL